VPPNTPIRRQAELGGVGRAGLGTVEQSSLPVTIVTASTGRVGPEPRLEGEVHRDPTGSHQIEAAAGMPRPPKGFQHTR
jgi:hypothetical protein